MNAKFPDTSPPKGERKRNRLTVAETAELVAVFNKAMAEKEAKIAGLRAELKVANRLQWSAFSAGIALTTIAFIIAHWLI